MGKTESIENMTKLKNMKAFFVLSIFLAFFASSLFLSCNNGSEKIVYVPAPVPNNGETATPAGGETQSGVITSVTEATIVDEIKKMTESGTVKASGVFDSKLIEDVKNAIIYLAGKSPSVLVTLDLSAVKGLSAFSFAYCKNLAGIVLPNDNTNMTSIGDDAFRGCTGLTSVTIPGSVTSIGHGAFRGCTGLTSVTIPSSVTSIGDEAFRYTGLTSVTIPGSVTSIGTWAFFECTGLASCNYTGTLEQWCNISFSDVYANPHAKKLCIQGQEIKDLVIPYGVTSIATATFAGCAGLTSVTIPSSVTSIGSGAFSGCKNISVNYKGTLAQWCNIDFSGGIPNVKLCMQGQEIKDLVIPYGVTSIGSCTFWGCAGLTSVTIPSSVTSIGAWAFEGCAGLTSVTIPSGVTSIGSCAFFGCAGLASVTIPSSVTSIGSSAFAGCAGLASVTIPSGVTSIGEGAFFECTGLASCNYTGTLEQWCKISFSSSSSNPCSYAKKFCIQGQEIKDLVIPDGVTSIGSHVFYGCAGIASVTIPSSVTSIGSSAFEGCKNLANAIFSDASGWYYSYRLTTGGTAISSASLADSATGGTAISSASLADSATAALYLRDRYCSYWWYKK